MASILQPLNVQSPASALQQSASAIGAYEQLMGIREAKERHAEQRQRQALVAQLTGRAMLGDQDAAQALAMTDPTALQALQKSQADIANTQAQTRLRQADLTQKLDANETTRLQRLEQGARFVKGSMQRIRQNPEQYAMVRNALITRGLVPEELLPADNPTIDNINEVEELADVSIGLSSNPSAMRELGAEMALAEQAYGRDDPRFKRTAESLIESEVALRRAKAESASQERATTSVNIPRGMELIDPSVTPSREETKEARKFVTSIAPVLSTINDLENLVGRTGFQVLPTTEAKRAQALASIIQLQLKDAFELGALDAGSERFLRKLFTDDPTQFRQDVVLAGIRDIRRQMSSRMQIQTGLRNYRVDLPTVLESTAPRTKGGAPAVTPKQRQLMRRYMRSQGLSKTEVDERMSEFDSVDAYRNLAQPATPSVAPSTSEREFVKNSLESGMSRDEIKRQIRLRRSGGSSQQSARSIIEGGM